jgi:Spy/CpxP family protein refolding chaperone
MVILPGIALAASHGIAQAQQAAASSSGGLTPKPIVRYSRLKGFYTFPKSTAKQAKYVSFLTTLLSLTPDQQTKAANIFAAAGTAHAAVKANIRTAREDLGKSVTSNSSTGIVQASTLIGKYATERHIIGATANAAFYQTLTSAQQATLSQFRD